MGLPQQTTEPSDFRAAKEPPKAVAWMATTLISCDRTELLELSPVSAPQVTTRPSEESAAKEAPNVSLEDWICVTSLNLSAASYS